MAYLYTRFIPLFFFLLNFVLRFDDRVRYLLAELSLYKTNVGTLSDYVIFINKLVLKKKKSFVTRVGRGSYEITLKPHLDLRNIVTDAATVRTGCIITRKKYLNTSTLYRRINIIIIQ